jgi:hypothetical protein
MREVKTREQMTNKRLRFSVIASAIVLFLLASSPLAHAVPTLYISDGTSSFTITDNGSLDQSSDAGYVTFSQSFGNWVLVISVGQTKPFLGSASNPYLDLFQVAASSSAGGTLQIKFSDNNYVSTAPIAIARIGGTTDGTVSYNTYTDAGNTTMAETTLLTSLGVFGPGSFSDAAVASAGFVAPYSLTLDTFITHLGSGFTGFDADLRVPDGGLTVGLLGIALLSLETVRRAVSKRPTKAIASKPVV